MVPKRPSLTAGIGEPVLPGQRLDAVSTNSRTAFVSGFPARDPGPPVRGDGGDRFESYGRTTVGDDGGGPDARPRRRDRTDSGGIRGRRDCGRGGPLENIGVMEDVKFVMRNGRVVKAP